MHVGGEAYRTDSVDRFLCFFVHLNYILHNETSSDYDSLESKEEQLAVMSALREVDMVELYPNFMQTHFCDIFLEEPEENLFPPTQSSLVDWMIEGVKGGKQGSRYNQPSNLFIATHSPYILNAFMEKQDIDMTLLYTRTTEGQITVKTATEEDIQAIYDYGVDAFFNIETLG